ncbi:hypothetical protein FHX82_003147 [Amycolatopsis bartoniae]|nr:hypothetical protein [Amycolatopsis bartoniae]
MMQAMIVVEVMRDCGFATAAEFAGTPVAA